MRISDWSSGVCSSDLFDNREKAFEDKFAYDAETAFRIAARRNRLLGLWAAEQMKLTPEEADAYAKAVVQADFEEAGDDDVIRKQIGRAAVRERVCQYV